MISINVPESADERLGLVPLETMRGTVSSPADSSLTLGGPVTIPLTAEAVRDDAVLAEYIKQTAQSHRFFLIHLACTFLPQNDEAFMEAWVEIRLTRSDSKDAALPIAWSMIPQKLAEDLEVTQTAKLGSELKLLELKILEAKSETTEKITHKIVYLEPWHEMESNPTWHLKSIEGVDIGGLYRFQLVVRSPIEAVAQGEIGLTANLRRKKWKIFPYKATFPGAPHKIFALS